MKYMVIRQLRGILSFGFIALSVLLCSIMPLHAQNQKATSIDSEIISDSVSSAVYLPLINNQNTGNTSVLGYGIQADLPARSQSQRAMVTTLYLGFDWIKDQVAYYRLYYYNSFWDERYFYWGHLDEVVSLADENDLHVIISITGIPQVVENSTQLNSSSPKDLVPTVAEMFTLIAERYCNSSLQAIEILNEPNLAGYEYSVFHNSPSEYVKLVQTVSMAVKSRCPSMQIISAGLAPTGNVANTAKDDLAFLEAWLDAGLGNYVDGIGAHPYGFNVPPDVSWEDACEAIKIHGNSFNGPCDTPHRSWSFRSTMESYHQVLTDKGLSTKPIWITEFGWAAGGAIEPGYEYANDNDYQEQADWTVEAYRMLENWGWARVAILWNLNYRVATPNQHYAQWGIVNQLWKPYPVFNALARMPKNGVITLAANQPPYDGTYAEELPVDPAQVEAIEAPEPLTIILFSTGLITGAAALQRRKSLMRKETKS